jgi:CDP-diacylglycerol--glycerol-3-phosphate 3-phosphatidyltransferase
MSSPRPRLTRRRLVGLDRSGPDPRETRAGEPLRPFTLPNLIGYARLVGIPIFLVLSFESGDGRTFWAAATFWLIAVGDFLDGLVARATGQYSRLGALLDPVVDRALVISGAVVCWHFELLPRWALAVLIVRELATLALAEIGIRRGIDLEINWLGRIGIILILAAIFFALVLSSWVVDAVFLVGLALSILATVVYVRSALSRTSAGERAAKSH